MPGWTEDYEAMSEALIGSPFDTKEEVEARIKAREDAQREWDARPWWGKAWHSSFEAKVMALFYGTMLFLLADGLLGTNEHVVAACVARTYVAPYVRRESVQHGKIHRDEDVHYGPYWRIAVKFPAGCPVRDDTYQTDQATFDKWRENEPINMVWRKGRWTGIEWKSWIGDRAEGD